MTLEVQTDVTPAPSPETELATPETPVEQPKEAPAAEPQNTDKPPTGYVPLQALHEAREQLKSLKESQDWKGYSRLKEALDSDPNFAKHFIESVQGYYTKAQQPKEDPYDQYPTEIAEPLRKTQVLEQTVQQLSQTLQQQQTQAVFQQYKASFSEKMKDVPQHWRGYYEKRAYEIGNELNPNALQGFDLQLVEKAYEMVHQEVEGIRRAERGSYVVEKKNDKLPASPSGGSAGQTIQKLSSGEDRTRMVEELLKASLA